MDPFVHIVPDLHDWIIQHCNRFDFKQMTTAAPSWNEILGNSKLIMEKIVLYLGHAKILTDDRMRQMEDVVAGTNRNYRNVLMDFLFDQSNSYHRSNKILSTLVNSRLVLTELQILSLELLLTRHKIMFEEINLSELKVLKLCYVTRVLTDLLLSRCNNLTRLTLNYVQERNCTSRCRSLPSLIPFLERQECLKILELNGLTFYRVFFIHNINAFARFKLNHLRVYYKTCEEFPDKKKIDQNFFEFLQKQSLNLVSIDINFSVPQVLEQIFNRMPLLKQLEIDKELNLSDIQNIESNETIIDLSFRTEDIVCTETIIRAVPNLRKLRTFRLNRLKVEYIRKKLLYLRELQYKRAKGCWRRLWPVAIPKRLPGGELWSIRKPSP